MVRPGSCCREAPDKTSSWIAAALVSIKITQSEDAIAFCGESAISAPATRKGSSFDGVRLYATTETLASRSRSAIGCPISPVPKNPTFTIDIPFKLASPERHANGRFLPQDYRPERRLLGSVERIL